MVHQWATAKSAIERDTQGHDHMSGSRDLVLATGPLEALGPFGICSGGSKRESWMEEGQREEGEEGIQVNRGDTGADSQSQPHTCTQQASLPHSPAMGGYVRVHLWERLWVRGYLNGAKVRATGMARLFNTQMVESNAASGHHKPHWQDLRKV